MLDLYITPGRGAVPIDDLTREEAIAALKETFRDLMSTRQTAKSMSDLHNLRSK